jgi:hypothetical protein
MLRAVPHDPPRPRLDPRQPEPQPHIHRQQITLATSRHTRASRLSAALRRLALSLITHF